MEDTNTQKAGKTLRGTVVGVEMKDTAKVAVARYVKHPKYKKFIKQVKKFLVHDPENTASVGDKVVIRESRPISKRKNFVLESNESTTK
ncbi:30S ribosomal protein S17 [Candidatus Kaiserbacteria bacterium]|nr:MAG: 30S ribosomal protein S17 [Candidatus Kaiserbacteria bacterium]